LDQSRRNCCTTLTRTGAPALLGVLLPLPLPLVPLLLSGWLARGSTKQCST
jgi:hypothetical protein